MKLGTRVTMAVTGVTGVALLASFASVSWLISRDEMSDMDEAILLQAHAFSERAHAREPVNPRVRDGFADMPEAFAAIPRYVALYDAQGRATSHSSNFGDGPPPLASLSVGLPLPEAGEPVELTVNEVRLRGVVVGVKNPTSPFLLYAAARKSIDEDVRFFRQAAGAIFLAAMVLTTLVARWISIHISRAVETVAGVARAVAEGDLDARVGPLGHGTNETRSLAANMDHMIAQLQALVLAQRTFISHAAHELRSPLSALRGELQLALRRDRGASEYKSTIQDALTDVETMTSLAADLLSLARAQAASEFEAVTAPVSVGDWLATAKDMARKARQSGVELTVAFEPASTAFALVQGPLGELSRALRNLVDNAVAHSDAGGRIELVARVSKDFVAVRVIDAGWGIPVEEQPHIFQPFFRGARDQASDRPGAGLGLAIVREIARRHGGDVELVPSEASGTTFELRLRRLPSEGLAVAGRLLMPE